MKQVKFNMITSKFFRHTKYRDKIRAAMVAQDPISDMSDLKSCATPQISNLIWVKPG